MKCLLSVKLAEREGERDQKREDKNNTIQMFQKLNAFLNAYRANLPEPHVIEYLFSSASACVKAILLTVVVVDVQTPHRAQLFIS